MIKQLNPLIFICTLFVLAFGSCKKEGVLEASDTNSILKNELKSLVNQVKLWHDSTVRSKQNTKVQNGIIAFSVNENDFVPPIVDWEKAFINFDSSTVKSITVPISMNYKNGERIQLVATRSKNKLNGYFIKITPDSSYFAKQDNIFNYSNFSGSITIYSLMGVRLKKQDFKTSVVSQSNNTSETALSNYTTHGDGFNSAIDLLEVTVISTKRKKYRFYGYDYGYFLIEVVNYIEKDQFGDGIVMVGGDESPDEPFEIKNNIKNPCLSSLVDRIINSKISEELNKNLKNVFGVNNKVNLIFEEAKLSNSARSKRDFTNPDNYTIQIDLSNFNENVSEEFIAAVIVHEISHMLIANTFVDYEIYHSADREKIMLDNYVKIMQSFLVQNFKLQDKQALSMIYAGMNWLAHKDYEFWNQETENYYFQKIKESGFNEIMNDPDGYTYFNEKFSDGSLGSNPCKLF